MLPPCLVPSYRHRPMMNSHRAFFIYKNGKSSVTIIKTQDTVYLKEITAPPTTALARLSESRSERQPISSVCISARPQKRRWRTKSSVCSVRKSAKCNFFLNLMKKSLTFRLWQDCKIHPYFPWCPVGKVQSSTDRCGDEP